MKASTRSGLLILALLAIFTLACGVCGFDPAAFNLEPQVQTPPEEETAEEEAFGQEEFAEEEPQTFLEEELEDEEEPPEIAEELPQLPMVEDEELPGLELNERLVALYKETVPGVVSILVQGGRGGGSGSGFIISERGHIVTNDHVVAGAEEVIVVYYNGLQARAEVIGTDDDSDLAVLEVENLPEDTHPLILADSDEVEPGQLAIAIGNPFGFSGTMTTGIVSAVGRTIESLEAGFDIPLAIQTDAAINPGNSGGPLLNAEGHVIGVNSQIYSPSGAFAGVGYAVPSNIVRQVVPFLIQEGRYVWPYLGVNSIPVSLSLVELLDLPVRQGAYIIQVVPGSPADEAGLRGAEMRIVDGLQIPVGGDIIVAANGERVNGVEDLLAQIAFVPPGEIMELTVVRGEREIELEVELGARPEEMSSSRTP